MVDIEEIKKIVKQAGQLVMNYFRADYKTYQKADKSPVTDADLACDQFLRQELQKVIPGAGFISEESKSIKGNEYTWVIDPIDGTKNFSHGLPYFCINVALMKNEEILLAITYAPALQEWFWAQKGQGMCHNGKLVQFDTQNWQNKGALIVVSHARIVEQNNLKDIKKACKPLTHVSFRLYGAAALDLAYVAVGYYDAVLFENLAWWDAVAGVLMLQEAGGLVLQQDRSTINQTFKSLIGGRSELCNLILPILS